MSDRAGMVAMVRYRYNQQIVPPAPFVHVTIRDPESQHEIADLPAQLDTAADLTVLPHHLVENLGVLPIDAIRIAGLGGEIVEHRTYFIDIALRESKPVTVKVVSDENEPYILLGRDVLNRLRVVLDGPKGVLEIE